MDDPSVLRPVLNVSHETIERLRAFETLLRRWQRKTNLVGSDTLDRYWSHHVGDAAFLLHAAPNVNDWTDIGAGAGLPGLALGILSADRSARMRVDLVESNAKKCAFQRSAVLQLKLREVADVAIHNERIEDHVCRPDTVLTARALAPLDRLIDHAKRLGVSRALFLKGERHAEEVAAARQRHDFDVQTVPHPLTPGSVLLDLHL